MQLGEPDVLLALRVSGLGAFALFALGFAATPVARLTGSRGLRARRRDLGVAAGLAVVLHLTLLPLLFAVRTSGSGLQIPGNPLHPLAAPVSVWLIGGTTALAVLAMLATSRPGVARRLGGARWRRLHRSGSWLIVAVVGLDLADALVRERRWVDLPWAALMGGLVLLRLAAFNKMCLKGSTLRA